MQISYYAKNNNPAKMTWVGHKLVDNLNNIGDIQLSQNEKNKMSK